MWEVSDVSPKTAVQGIHTYIHIYIYISLSLVIALVALLAPQRKSNAARNASGVQERSGAYVPQIHNFALHRR